MLEFIQSAAKAFVSAVVVATAYLVGVIPAEGSFGDVNTVQWLGLVLFVGSAFGFTYETANREPHGVRQDESVQPAEPQHRA